MLTPDQLDELGFRQIRKDLWLKLRCTQREYTGTVAWTPHDGVVTYAGAQIEMATARKLAASILAGLSDDSDSEHKRKARKVLTALLATDLERNMVEGHTSVVEGVPCDASTADDLKVVIGSLRSRRRERRQRRRERRRERRKRRHVRRSQVKASFNRMARRVAKAKVLQRMRDSMAKLQSGPIGAAGAKLVSKVLAVYGIPPAVSEAAIRNHQRAQADRLRRGGWAGELERSSRKGGHFGRDLLKEEFHRQKAAGSKTIREMGTQARASAAQQGSSGSGNNLSSFIGQSDYAQGLPPSSNDPDYLHGYRIGLLQRGVSLGTLSQIGGVS